MDNLKFRAADLLLDRVLNPTNSPEFARYWDDDLIEYCGLIPDFFCVAVMDADPMTLDEIAAHMDECYQFGGFSHPFGGDLTIEGVYQSEHAEDPDLHPIARFSFDRFQCFVYQYGLCAIRDASTGELKIGRFD